MKPTAILRDVAMVFTVDDPAIRLQGRVYSDLKKRFADGAMIRTSPIREWHASIGIVVTERSFYRVEP